MYGPGSARAFDTFYIMCKSLLERSSVARDLYFNLRITNVHVQCIREDKALAKLRICADSSGHSRLAAAICAKFSCSLKIIIMICCGYLKKHLF